MTELFSETFVRLALAAGLVTALPCAALGVHVVLRRVVFLGMTVAQTAALGVALAAWTGTPPAPTAFAAVFLLLGLMARFRDGGRLSSEAALGAAYAAAAAGSAALLSANPAAEADGLDLLAGNILYARPADLAAPALAALAASAIILLLRRPLAYVAFDRETAESQGVPAGAVDAAFFLALGLVVSAGMRAAGILHLFAALVLPSSTGLLLARTIDGAVAFALAAAGLSVTAGIALSVVLDLPTSPLVVLFEGALLLAAGLAMRVRERRITRKEVCKSLAK